MKRTVSLPHKRAEVYHAFMDPILLSGWLNVPYVSTGHGELHLFEIEDWNKNHPWKIRCFILDSIRDESFRIEKDEIGDHHKPGLDLRLVDSEQGCELSLEWEDSYFDRLAKELLDPRGHLRLGHLIAVETTDASETP